MLLTKCEVRGNKNFTESRCVRKQDSVVSRVKLHVESIYHSLALIFAYKASKLTLQFTQAKLGSEKI